MQHLRIFKRYFIGVLALFIAVAIAAAGGLRSVLAEEEGVREKFADDVSNIFTSGSFENTDAGYNSFASIPLTDYWSGNGISAHTYMDLTKEQSYAGEKSLKVNYSSNYICYRFRHNDILGKTININGFILTESTTTFKGFLGVTYVDGNGVLRMQTGFPDSYAIIDAAIVAGEWAEVGGSFLCERGMGDELNIYINGNLIDTITDCISLAAIDFHTRPIDETTLYYDEFTAFANYDFKNFKVLNDDMTYLEDASFIVKDFMGRDTELGDNIVNNGGVYSLHGLTGPIYITATQGNASLTKKINSNNASVALISNPYDGTLRVIDDNGADIDEEIVFYPSEAVSIMISSGGGYDIKGIDADILLFIELPGYSYHNPVLITREDRNATLIVKKLAYASIDDIPAENGSGINGNTALIIGLSAGGGVLIIAAAMVIVSRKKYRRKGTVE